MWKNDLQMVVLFVRNLTKEEPNISPTLEGWHVLTLTEWGSDIVCMDLMKLGQFILCLSLLLLWDHYLLKMFAWISSQDFILYREHSNNDVWMFMMLKVKVFVCFFTLYLYTTIDLFFFFLHSLCDHIFIMDGGLKMESWWLIMMVLCEWWWIVWSV